MKKPLTRRLTLNRETLRNLSEREITQARGGGPSNNYGECLTDRCSIAYCFTTGPTCPK